MGTRDKSCHLLCVWVSEQGGGDDGSTAVGGTNNVKRAVSITRPIFETLSLPGIVISAASPPILSNPSNQSTG